MLIGACAGRGLDQDGGYDELYRRLGDHLVRELFSTKKRKRESAGHAFLKEERENIKQAGFKGRIAIIQEAARRWKLFKKVNTENVGLSC